MELLKLSTVQINNGDVGPATRVDRLRGLARWIDTITAALAKARRNRD